MYKHITILLFLLLPVFTQAQNLVSNGDFEYYTSCPSGATRIDSCIGWRRYHGGTPDYFNVCGGNDVKVPNNLFGYQHAASGNAYVGGFVFLVPSNPNNFTEYVASTINPTTIGTRYEVSLSVSLANNSSHGCNGLGVWFYDIGPSSTGGGMGSGTLAVSPQISYSNYGILTDTQNWVRLSKIFTADSAYDNIVIGRFNPSSGLQITNVGGGMGPYYYIDSVVIKYFTGINNLYTDTLLCAGDAFYVPYIPDARITFNSNNVFFVQLSNPLGSFSSGTTIIGSLASSNAGLIPCTIPLTIMPSNNYRIRILSNSPVDSSDASKPIRIGQVRPAKPTVSNNGPLCTGDSLILTANSSNALSYFWNGPDTFKSNLQVAGRGKVKLSSSGYYVATVYNYGCIAKDSTNVIIYEMPLPVTATSNSPICERDTLKLFSSSSTIGATYIWNGPSGYSSTIQNEKRANALPTMSGDYIVTATLGTFCVQKDTVAVIVKPVAPNFTVTANTPVCENDTFTITANSSNLNVTYSWQAPIPVSDTGTILWKAPLNASGKYVVYATLNTCTIKDSVDVIVTPIPANFSVSYNTPLCAGDSLSLMGNTGSSGVIFNWSGPNNFIDTTKYPFIKNAQTYHSGKYILNATLGNCSITDSTNVVIKPSPLKPITNSDTILCEGEILHLNADSITSSADYTWNGPDNFISQQIRATINPVTLKASGAYVITANLDGCLQRDTAEVLVKPLPEIPIINSNSPLQTGQDLYLNLDNQQANVKYRWTGPNGFTSVVPNPIIYKPDTNSVGTYFMIAELNGCYNSNQVLVQIDQRADTGNIFLYPNPNNGDFYIKGIFKTDQQMPVRIFDGAGKLVYTNVFKTNNKKLFEPISLRDYLASGEYSFHIITDGKKRIIRFTVIR